MLDNDMPVMVGLSGGKDSITLLYILHEFKRISKYKYPLAAAHIDLGFNPEYPQILEDYCKSLGVPFFYEKTEIGKIIFEARKEENPCSLCAKMRRGALNKLAANNGYHKIALGHHMDDVVETLLLKIFYEGNIGCFNPVTYLDRSDITVIRPFVFAQEELVDAVRKNKNLPVIKNLCPADGNTKRQEIKEMLKLLTASDSYTTERAVLALYRLFGANWDGQHFKS